MKSRGLRIDRCGTQDITPNGNESVPDIRMGGCLLLVTVKPFHITSRKLIIPKTVKE
jgi:hypothetical protein